MLKNTQESRVPLERRAPIQARSRDRREQILKAAQELIEQDGNPDEITTRHIADRAGVPIGSVYYIFPNVHAVYFALLSRSLAEARTTVLSALRNVTSSWRGQIDTLVDTLFHVFFDTPTIGALWLHLRYEREMEKLNEEDNMQWEASTIAFFRTILPDLPVAELEITAQIHIHMCESFLAEALRIEDVAARETLIREWKICLKAYLEAKMGNRATN